MRTHIPIELLKSLFYSLPGAIRFAPKGAPFVSPDGKTSECSTDWSKVLSHSTAVGLISDLMFEEAVRIRDCLPERDRLYFGGRGLLGAMLMVSVLQRCSSYSERARGFMVEDSPNSSYPGIQGHMPDMEGGELANIFLLDIEAMPVFNVCKQIENHGQSISGVIVLIDKEDGGVLRLQQKGYEVSAIMTLTELIEYRKKM